MLKSVLSTCPTLSSESTAPPLPFCAATLMLDLHPGRVILKQNETCTSGVVLPPARGPDSADGPAPDLTALSAGLGLLFGFACGSIPFGYFAGRLKATDIRTRGSGNIGFTNVLRTFGWTWAVPVLVLDAAKGLLPVMLAARLNLVPALVGLGAVLGHIFTPWLGFKGGKGVATTLGVTAFLCPRALLAGLVVYLVALLGSGFISLASLAFALLLPFLVLLLYPNQLPLFLFSLGLCLIIIFRHRGNIERLSKGAEPRLGLWLRLFRRER